MVRSFTGKTALRLALVATAAASLAACQTKPKPTYPTQPPSQPTAPPSTPLPPTTGPVTGQPNAPLPGSAQDFVVNVGDRVYFDTDSHDIREDARPLLTAQSEWLRRYPSVVVRIEGNADERGTREYNLALGDRRANAAKNYLASRGINPARISTISYGKERPIALGSDEASWAQNRRAVTIVLN